MNVYKEFKGYNKMTIDNKAELLCAFIYKHRMDLGHRLIDSITSDIFDWLHYDEEEAMNEKIDWEKILNPDGFYCKEHIEEWIDKLKLAEVNGLVVSGTKTCLNYSSDIIELIENVQVEVSALREYLRRVKEKPNGTK